MEEEIKKLQKEVTDLQFYSIHCTNVIQDLLSIMQDLMNGVATQSDIDTLKKYIHENI